MAGQRSFFTHDVFLSLCGSDTRHGFADNLLRALHDRGISTFINEDEEGLLRGEEVTPPALVKAIKESRMAIIVFSENYVASSLCYIVESFQPYHQFILPVYYDVDPSDVRHQRGTYGEVLARLEEEEKLKGNKKEKVRKWRNAVSRVANLSGWNFKLGTGYDEFEFLARIVEEVCNRAPSHAADEVESIGRINVEEVSNRAPLLVVDSSVRDVGHDELESYGRRIKEEVSDFAPSHVADYMVGLEPQMEEMMSLLDLGSDEVRIVGIWGMGGVGKTTLAQAIFNRTATQFEASYFFHNVREESNILDGSLRLQNRLLSQIAGEALTQIGNVNNGFSMIKHKLQQTKFLIVLDDVDSLDQLEDLFGSTKRLGPGSRIIITTRDRHVLTLHGVEKRYQVQPLNASDALELFRRKAFQHDNFDPSNTEILNKAVAYASGLPLALEVLGSFLSERGAGEWRDRLDGPDKEIQRILKESYDSLQEDEKSVFLDIACCFKGYELAVLQDILFAHYGQRMEYHIQLLIDKSLIKTTSDNKVTVLHPLLEHMGKEIVCQESPEEPGKRSRLWFPEDVIHVLTKKTGTSNIEIIHLDFPLTEDKGVIEWDGEAFTKMENLRTLIFRKCHFSKAPKHLPNSLRVLEWWRYPSHELPSDFNPKQLKIRKLPDMGFVSPKQAELLKTTQSVPEISWTSQQTSTRVAGVMLQSSHRIPKVSQTSMSVFEISQTSQSVPQVLQTSTRVDQDKLLISHRYFQAEIRWRLVGLLSSVVGLSCHAQSPSFNRLIGGWNPFKFFVYGVLSLVIFITILYAKHRSLSTSHARLKTYMCFAVLMIISVYSYLYDRAVNGKPEIRSLLANAAFAMVSLSLSKLFKFGFEMGTFSYFLTCFTVQLLTIDRKLILVAIIFGCPLFVMHSSSESRPVVGSGGPGPHVTINMYKASP